jgi:predicted acylesterase/phospholipase RssA
MDISNLDNDLINLIKILDINTLVISGGGVKGYSFLGSLMLLQKYGILKKIKYFYGTSIGAILSAVLILDWNIDEIYRFAIKYPFDNMLNINLDKIVNDYSLVDQKDYETLLKKMISYKNFDPNITLRELYNKTNKEIHLITYNMRTCSEETLNYLTYPDLMLWEGLYMSSALPLVFNPYEYKTNIYIDGGIVNNFPIKNVKSENRFKTIGICTDNYIIELKLLQKYMTEKNLINLIALFSEMIKMYFNKENKPKNEQLDKLCFKIYNTTNMINIDYPKEESIKIKMIENGYKDSVKQINSVLNHILKNQIKESFIKTSKYNEV